MKMNIVDRLRVHAAWANNDGRLGDQEAFDLAANELEELDFLRHEGGSQSVAAMEELLAEAVAMIREERDGFAESITIFSTGQFAEGEEHTKAAIARMDDWLSRTTSAGVPQWMAGISRIAAERRRQVEEEGFTLRHDTGNLHGEMAGAAACYALYRSQVDPVHLMGMDPLSLAWPWAAEWWKPSDPIRDLEKSGALIAAEIDRLLSARGGRQ